MPLPMSRNQLDHLGQRLRSTIPPADEDLRSLQEVILAHRGSLAAVADGLLSLGLRPTTRLKTSTTLLDKLRRESGMRLSQVHDIAGARIVEDVDLLGQTDLGRRISDRWPGAKLVDRLHEPSWGYRALHVIVQEEGCWVEVQVRTYWQDVWAQISERLADAWGRQIRYGAPPDPPDDLGKGLTRTQVLAVVQDLSTRVESYETLWTGLADLRREERRLELPPPSPQEVEALERAVEQRRRLLEPLAAILEGLPAFLGDA